VVGLSSVIVVLLGYLSLASPSAVSRHDFTRDFLVGDWYCRDAGPQPVIQRSRFIPEHFGRDLVEIAVFRTRDGRLHRVRSVISFGRIPESFTWGFGTVLDPTGGYVSRRWFHKGVLRMGSRLGRTWIELRQHGSDAFAFTSGGTFPDGSTSGVRSICTRVRAANLTDGPASVPAATTAVRSSTSLAGPRSTTRSPSPRAE
jgi:hypothetical protein